MRRPGAVYIAFEVFPRRKGASTHIATMVRALAARHAPVLLLSCGHGEMPAFQVEGDIVIRRHKMHYRNMLSRALDFGRFVYETLGGLERPPALGVFRDPWGGLPFIEALPGSPAVFEVNALPSWELAYRYPALRSNFALQAKIEDMERACLRHARCCITVSALTRDTLAAGGVPLERIEVIPNAAAGHFFSPGPGPNPIPDLASGRWFGYFGSLHPWQGVDLLVEAWARVAEDFPDVRLLVIHNGRKPSVAGLRRLIRLRKLKERVLLQAPLPPRTLSAILPGLEFSCAPLRETARNVVQGCCPIKIVESLAAGVPVLGANLRVVRDLYTHEREGLWVEPDEPRAWANAIARMLAAPGLRRVMSGAARALARDAFTRGASFARLDALFEKACSGGTVWPGP